MRAAHPLKNDYKVCFFFQVIDIQTGELLGPNQSGEVCMRGPTIMKG